jgi:hypothetical protein
MREFGRLTESVAIVSAKVMQNQAMNLKSGFPVHSRKTDDAAPVKVR